MKLFVGLGNPGAEYSRHRHNVGFMAIDRIADKHRFPAWRRRFQAETAEADIAGERVLLLKPQTYMNESGRAVGEAARFLKIATSDIVVFHDELDLAPGKLRVKVGGGNAGHNGLRSITAHLDNEYVRVRIGIGHPGHKDAVSGYVLHDFAKAEGVWLEPMLDAMADAAGRLTGGDAQRFMTDVARALGETAEPAKAEPKSPRKTADAGGASGGGGRHPAGERAAKRQSALAENLAKWLQRKGES
jgi:PTH1 family peptidyl-tRNA hydrolase